MGGCVVLQYLLGRIGETYDRSLGQTGEAQDLLKDAPGVVSDIVPAQFTFAASGGKGNAATVPWIAIFHPDETNTAQRGMYVVYLFDADMKTVVLSLNQGVTELVKAHGTRVGRELLRTQATAIRDGLPVEQQAMLEPTIDLRSKNSLPRDYEAGNILARTYDLQALPDDSTLAADLHMFMDLYELARDVRMVMKVLDPASISTAVPVRVPEAELEFKPKDSSDYQQDVAKRKLKKSRDHEKVLERYVGLLKTRGYSVGNNVHPRDLVAIKASAEWLIEVKVVYRRNGINATRDALSQLLMYQDSLYDADKPRMLAVFSEDVGSYGVEFLEKFGIASVWKDGAGWAGSPTAVVEGLC
jgi:hypothetical protein